MLTIQQKAQCVLWYHKLKLPTAVQRKFKNEFGQNPPHINNIKRWFKNFMKTGSILDCKRLGRPSIDKETVDAVHVAFHCSPKKSIYVASNELAIAIEIFKFKILINKLYFVFFLFTAIGDFNLWYQRTHCSFCRTVNMFHTLLQTYAFIKNDLFLLIIKIK